MTRPAPARGRARLSADALSIRLGNRVVLEGVDLEVLAGRRLAVVGPNGSGKTTLLRALAGIVRSSAGEASHVRLDGRPLGRIPRRELARRVGFMPQQSDLRFPMSGLEAVLLGRSPHKRGLGLASDRDVALAEAAMRRLEIAHLGDRPVTSLSGGERQRLMLARVLVQEVDVLLLDEPTSAQDPHGVLLVRDVIADEAGGGAAVVAAVHDLNLALRAFDSVLVLADGHGLGEGRPTDVVDSGWLEEAFAIRLRRVPDGDGFWVVGERAGRKPAEAPG